MQKIIALLLLLCLSTPAFAATLEVSYQFKGKAPKGAILFFPHSKGNNHPVTLKQKNKKFNPLFLTVAQNKMITILNNDSVDHNVYVMNEKQNIHFDIGLKKPGEEAKIKASWPKNQLVRLNCNIHSKMRAWVAVVDSNFNLISNFTKKNKDASGQYKSKLTKIPNKLKKLTVLIPSFKSVKVDLSKKSSQKIALIKRGKEKGWLTLNYSK